MKISYNWLKDYLDFSIEPNALAEIFTNTGLEVEGIEVFESIKGSLNDIVVGEVKECVKHPNADKLFVATVDTGEQEPAQIVCGAPNVAKGQKVLVAKSGTSLYVQDKPLKIKKTKIRGEISEGMICSEDEVGLGEDHTGIVVLPEEAVPGTPAAEYFNIEQDTVFEIGLTPNRIDGASHIGAARDLAAFLSLEFDEHRVKIPSVDPFGPDDNSLHIPVEIKNKDACRRYAGLTMSGLKVGPSPAWLQNRLRSIGLAPINNIVDITNYVLHETGQPLHAFDTDKISGNKIIVRTLPENTEFVTLDEEKWKLSSEDLMICDTEKGMCIGGVFGGLHSGVTEKTTSIFLESAWFDPVYIRKTSKRHALNTDASFRFERGADPNMTLYALKRAALLIREIAGGKISSEIVDEYPGPHEPVLVNLRFRQVQRLIGKYIDPDTIEGILRSLDFRILKKNEKQLKVEVPPYRVDVTREADVIEEILRIYGYNKVEVPPRMLTTLVPQPFPDNEKYTRTISAMLVSQGFNEIMNNSLSSVWYYKNEKDNVRLTNPLSSDLEVMRENLLYGGLETILYNINRKNSDLKLFEFGNVYRLSGNDNKEPLAGYRERTHLALFLTGKKTPPHWRIEQRDSDLYTLKSYVELIHQRIGLDPREIEWETCADERFLKSICIRWKNMETGKMGSVHPETCKMFDLEEEVYFSELFWNKLLETGAGHEVSYSQVPRFMQVRRDLSMELDRNILFKDIEKLAHQTEKKLLKRVVLFDVYKGEHIAENKKSYAITFVLLDENKTLTDKEIDRVMNNLQSAFERKLDARIRK